MKNIETSITITAERRDRLIEASKELHVPVRVILAALMRKTRSIYTHDRAVLWRAVRYQKDMPNKYKIWHVSLDPVCYEFGVSERLVFKVSVSRIFAAAIDLYLDTLVENGLNSQISSYDKATSYKKARYNLLFFENQSDEFWVISWDQRIKKE